MTKAQRLILIFAGAFGGIWAILMVAAKQPFDGMVMLALAYILLLVAQKDI